MLIRCVSWNVLADEYFGRYPQHYRHVARDLMVSGARIQLIVDFIAALNADVVCLQEVELPLYQALASRWQTFWTPKENNEPDGCLTLVRHGVTVEEGSFESYAYPDLSSHVAQAITIGGVRLGNTHIKWAPDDDPDHCGIRQARDLLEWLRPYPQAVIFADCNDRPGGPVRALISGEGYVNLVDVGATAFVNGGPAELDIIAVRGTAGTGMLGSFSVNGIPNRRVPSDHIPVLGNVRVGN